MFTGYCQIYRVQLSTSRINCGSNFAARVCAEFGVAYGLVVTLLVVVAGLV